MSLRSPHAVLLALVLGVAVGAIVFLGQPADDEPDVGPVLEEDTEDEEDVESALLAGRAAKETLEREGPNPFADESDFLSLFVAAANYKTKQHAWARIEELLREGPARIQELLELLRPGDTTRDRYLAHRWEQIGALLAELGRPGLTALLDALEDEDPHFQMRIAACLGPFGARAAPAVPRLIDLMHAADEEPRAKKTALYVNVLGRIGPAAKDVLPDLHRWLDEGETQVVEVAAARALVRIGGPTKAVFQRAADVIAVGPWQAQRNAITQELGALGKRAAPMIPELLDLARNGEDAAVQGTAVNLLGMIGVPDPRVISQLERDLTGTTSLGAFSGPWAFALSKLGPDGRAALVRAVEAHAPLSAGFAARHLRTAKVSSKRIWELLEPGVDLKKTGEDRVWMLGAVNYYLGSETKVPVEAAIRLVPDLMRFPPDGSFWRLGLRIAFQIDKPTVTWCEALQAIVRDKEIRPEYRSDVAGLLTRTTIADKAKTLEGIRALIAEDPSDGTHYHRLFPFVDTHPGPVLTEWKRGVEQGAVDWDYLRRALTKGKPPQLRAPKSIADAIRAGTQIR